MENQSRAPRIIIILLGLLLLAGAVAAAFAFDGAKWLTANPVLAQPQDEALEQKELVPVTGPNSGFDTIDEQYSPSRPGCNHDSAISPDDL